MSAPTILVHWHCGLFTEPPTWGGEDGPECDADWVTEENTDDWAAGICWATCPGCGGDVYQRDGHAELIST